MILAFKTLEPGAEAAIYGVAVLLFVVALVLSLIPNPKHWWVAAISAGWALVVFVSFYNAAARA